MAIMSWTVLIWSTLSKTAPAGDKYYKIVYSYYSYDGYNYEDADVYEVVPVERLVTFYE